MSVTAEPVAGTDHNTVCRFETMFDRGWHTVLDSLMELKKELLEQGPAAAEGAENVLELA